MRTHQVLQGKGHRRGGQGTIQGTTQFKTQADKKMVSLAHTKVFCYLCINQWTNVLYISNGIKPSINTNIFAYEAQRIVRYAHFKHIGKAFLVYSTTPKVWRLIWFNKNTTKKCSRLRRGLLIVLLNRVTPNTQGTWTYQKVPRLNRNVEDITLIIRHTITGTI